MGRIPVQQCVQCNECNSLRGGREGGGGIEGLSPVLSCEYSFGDACLLLEAVSSSFRRVRAVTSREPGRS